MDLERHARGCRRRSFDSPASCAPDVPTSVAQPRFASRQIRLCSIELGGAITRTTMHRSQPLRLFRAFASINLLARLIKRYAQLARYRREHRPLAGPRKGAWLPS